MSRIINNMYAYIAENEDGEGIVGDLNLETGIWAPLVFSDKKLALLLRPRAQKLSQEFNKTIKLVKFNNPEILEIFIKRKES